MYVLYSSLVNFEILVTSSRRPPLLQSPLRTPPPLLFEEFGLVHFRGSDFTDSELNDIQGLC